MNLSAYHCSPQLEGESSAYCTTATQAGDLLMMREEERREYMLLW